ncbi:MAG: DUF1549 domain-containing protein, partial [Acidobacteriota bacterium]|nr:DUF1549 domain-containing protein [Acidobacteriota bacterium]
MKLKSTLAITAFLLISLGVGSAANPPGVALLESHCFACHNSKSAQNKLDLTTKESALRGGERGPAIVAGNSRDSLVYQFASRQLRPFMPPVGAALSSDELKTLASWIDSGASWPNEAGSSAQPVAPVSVVQPVKTVEHWAFRKPVSAPLPKLSGSLASWSKNPVDILLAAKWQEKGLEPSPEADRRTLLRRVYIDVAGLPPTPAQLEAFLRDRSPNAYEKVVDSLLDSPRYGERWGRHWMDIWRYSDWYGRRQLDEQRNSARHIWHWRDWIIESLNADKGYDQMIREMIAGDEIAPNDPKVLRATGFLARDYYRFNRNVWMQDTVEHIGFGMLGLTLKCARCHDHKYDPITQEEYYRFRAFFEPYDVRTDRISGKADTHDDGIPRVFDSLPHDGGVEPYFPPIYKDTFRLIRGEESNPDKKALTPGTPAVLGAWNEKIELVKLTAQEH